MEEAIRSALEHGEPVKDSQVFADAHGFAHADLVGVCKSLSTGGFIVTESLSRFAADTTGSSARPRSEASPPRRAGNRCS